MVDIKHMKLYLFMIIGTIIPFSSVFAYKDYIKGPNCNPERLSNPSMQRVLNVLARKNGEPVLLTSCFRDKKRQEYLLARGGCARTVNGKRIRGRNCSGRIASRSQHTYGVAVDPQLNRRTRGAAVCRMLDATRKEALGGIGGVGAYGAYTGHIDIRNYYCNWNICKGAIGPCQPSRRRMQGGAEGDVQNLRAYLRTKQKKHSSFTDFCSTYGCGG